MFWRIALLLLTVLALPLTAVFAYWTPEGPQGWSATTLFSYIGVISVITLPLSHLAFRNCVERYLFCALFCASLITIAVTVPQMNPGVRLMAQIKKGMTIAEAEAVLKSSGLFEQPFRGIEAGTTDVIYVYETPDEGRSTGLYDVEVTYETGHVESAKAEWD